MEIYFDKGNMGNLKKNDFRSIIMIKKKSQNQFGLNPRVRRTWKNKRNCYPNPFFLFQFLKLGVMNNQMIFVHKKNQLFVCNQLFVYSAVQFGIK